MTVLIICHVNTRIPIPNVPFRKVLNLFSASGGSITTNTVTLLGLFSNNTLDCISIFSLNVVPCVADSVVLRVLRTIIPSLRRLTHRNRINRAGVARCSHCLALTLTVLGSINCLFLFGDFNVDFGNTNTPRVVFSLVVINALATNTVLVV